jgi:hypothetical protein
MEHVLTSAARTQKPWASIPLDTNIYPDRFLACVILCRQRSHSGPTLRRRNLTKYLQMASEDNSESNRSVKQKNSSLNSHPNHLISTWFWDIVRQRRRSLYQHYNATRVYCKLVLGTTVPTPDITLNAVMFLPDGCQLEAWRSPHEVSDKSNHSTVLLTVLYIYGKCKEADSENTDGYIKKFSTFRRWFLLVKYLGVSTTRTWRSR